MSAKEKHFHIFDCGQKKPRIHGCENLLWISEVMRHIVLPLPYSKGRRKNYVIKKHQV